MKSVMIGTLSVLLIYWLVILASGAGINVTGVNWDFERTGQFGDSFGPLSAIMSSIAAVSALSAYKAQREELDRLKASAEEEQRRVAQRDFEDTFFRLVGMLRDVVKAIDIPGQSGTKYGTDALSSMVQSFYYSYNYFNRDSEGITDEKCYEQFYENFKNDLGHYFRLFYHFVNYIARFKSEEQTLYIRILRSTLSHPEMTLIGLNCAYGEGKSKLAPLVADYALLHNISSSIARDYKLTNILDPRCFGDREVLFDGGLSG